MGFDKNDVNLIGTLGDDADFKEVGTGKKVCNFSMATNENYVDANGKDQQATQWHRVVAWGKLAEDCSELKKGERVHISGKLQTRKWEDKNKNTRYTTEVLASHLV